MSRELMAIVLCGVVMLAMRGVAFVFADRVRLPGTIGEMLQLMPPVILATILESSVLPNEAGSALDFGWGNHYLWATLVTLLLARKVRSFPLVLVMGYLSILAFNYLGWPIESWTLYVSGYCGCCH